MSSSTKRTPNKLSTKTTKQTARKGIRFNKGQNDNQRTVAKPLICDRSPSLARHRILAQRSKNEEVRKFREMIREVYHQTDGLSSFTQTSVLTVPPEVTSDRYLLGQYKYAKKMSSASNSEVSSQYSQESEKALELEPDQLINQIRSQVQNQIHENNQKEAEQPKKVFKKPEKPQSHAQSNLNNQSQRRKNENILADQNEIKIDGNQYVKEPINDEKESEPSNQLEDVQHDTENSIEEEEEEVEFEEENQEEAQNEIKSEEVIESNEQLSNFDQTQEEEEIDDEINNQQQEQINNDGERQDQEESLNSNENEEPNHENADNFIDNENQEKDVDFNELYNSAKEEVAYYSHGENEEGSNFNELYNASQKESENLAQSENENNNNLDDLYNEAKHNPTNFTEQINQNDNHDSTFNELNNPAQYKSANFAQTLNNVDNANFNENAVHSRTAYLTQKDNHKDVQYNENVSQGNELEIEADVEIEEESHEEEHDGSNKEALTTEKTLINSSRFQKPGNLNLASIRAEEDESDDKNFNSDHNYNPNERPLVSPRSYKSPFSPKANLKDLFRFPAVDINDPNLKRSGEQLLEISVRPFLYNLSVKYGEPIRCLREIPEFEFLDWKSMGFQWVWLYGVWKLGNYCLDFDLTDHDLKLRYDSYLPGWQKEDVIGYPLSIVSYDVNPEIGDIDDLIWFREKLRSLNIRLMLDFVPNHTAIDAPEVLNHPEYYIHSKSSPSEKVSIDESRFIKEKGNIAYGAGVNMPPMKFTAQLNIFTPEAKKMQIDNLLKIAKFCDGVRVHLAHFLLTEQFQTYWTRELNEIGLKAPENEFWQEAIEQVRLNNPEFIMMAESYGTENQQRLLECGFSFIYEKELIDHLVSHDVAGFRDLIFKNHFITDKMVHFIENHDEPRMITRFNGSSKQAMTASAALLTLPGVRLINMQQWLGYRSQIDVNLRRAMPEQCNQEIVKFYTKLLNILACPAILYGEWKPISVLGECSDRIVAWKWVLNKQHILVTINFNNCWSQGRIICDDANIDSMTIYVLEMISDTYYTRDPYEMRENGLMLSLEPYQAQIFEY